MIFDTIESSAIGREKRKTREKNLFFFYQQNCYEEEEKKLKELRCKFITC